MCGYQIPTLVLWHMLPILTAGRPPGNLIPPHRSLPNKVYVIAPLKDKTLSDDN